MSINFLNLSNRYKNTAISLSIAGLVLQSCTNYESNRNMETEAGTERTEGRQINRPKESNCCKLFTIGLGCFVLGGLSGAIGLPIMNSEWNSTKNELNQVSNSLYTTQSQAALLAQPLGAILADSPNANYTLSNDTTIYGNSSNLSDLSYTDILGITGISLTSTEFPYTAAQEFGLIELTQMIPSLPNLQSAAFSGQYFSNSVDFTTTPLNSIDLTNSYLNALLIFPNEISNAVLTNTTLCSGGLLICKDGAIDSPNCNNQTINSEFIELNTNILLGNPICTNYTQYQQLLTNYNDLNTTYTALESVLSGTGAMTLADTLANYNTLQDNFYILNNTLFSCNGTNCATAYNTCSNNGQSPNASALYKVCSNNGGRPNCASQLSQLCNTQVWCGSVGSCCSQVSNNPVSNCGTTGFNAMPSIGIC